MNQSLWKVLLVAVAGGFEVTITWGRFTGWSTMAGLILVSILLSVPLSAVTNWSERLTLSLAWGVSLVLVLGRPFKPWLLDLGAAGVSPSKVMFSVWIAISALSYLVTRRLASQQGRED